MIKDFGFLFSLGISIAQLFACNHPQLSFQNYNLSSEIISAWRLLYLKKLFS